MIHAHVLDLVGNTPLVDLPGLGGPQAAQLAAKVEYLNPGGSIKDRIAVAMIEAAEESGALQPGGTIVEPTSGNTGVGLAIAANQRGYRCVFVCPDKVSQDKIATLRAYGVRVEVCPTAVAPEDPRSYYSVSDRLVREIPGAWKPDQYSNPANPAVHYRTTGPELWEQSEGRITHLVAGIGTGGTISGAGKYLKEVSGGRVRVIGADPVGSVYSGGSGRPYLVEGVGEDFWPEAYDRDVCDEIVAVTDRDAFAMTRRLAVEHGLLVGGSSGMAAAAAAEVARRAAPGDLVIVILPDGGRGYLSKVFDDEWMRAFGFLREPSGVTVRDVLASRDGRLPDLIHVHPNEPIRDAITLFHEFGVSQVPVLTAEPPVVVSEVIGAVSERHLLDLLFRGEADLADPVRAHVGPPLPTCGIGEPIGEVIERLGSREALLVLSDGAPTGIITRQDALSFLSVRDCDG
jgi:cystathionine beta-synthase